MLRILVGIAFLTMAVLVFRKFIEIQRIGTELRKVRMLGDMFKINLFEKQMGRKYLSILIYFISFILIAGGTAYLVHLFK
jgi:hypothetical protein